MFKFLIWLKEVDSTQTKLKEGNFPNGTVFVADLQKGGKGRKGRRWESREGGLYFSFVLSAADFKESSQLPLVVGLAVSQALEEEGLKTFIKWPNDVYVRGKKIAGVLVERSKDRVIVGIGVNLNQREFNTEIKNTAISLYQITGTEVNRIYFLSKLLNIIDKHLRHFSLKGFSPFFKGKIEEKLLFKGEEVIAISDKPQVGILLGIDVEGFLILKTASGYLKVNTGDISLRLYR